MLDVGGLDVEVLDDRSSESFRFLTPGSVSGKHTASSPRRILPHIADVSVQAPQGAASEDVTT